METFLGLLFGDFAIYLPKIVFWASWVAAAYFYFIPRPRAMRCLAIFLASFRLLYVGFLIYGQHFIWSQNEFTKFFVEYQNGSYFSEYAWVHFGLNAVLSITGALLFWTLLRSLKSYRERFFYEGETELGLVLALICGWPGILIFICFSLVMVVLVSIFKILFTKEKYTTLGVPLLLACPVVLLGSVALVDALRLGALKI